MTPPKNPQLRIETFEIGPFPNNLYALIDDESKTIVVIDPSIESQPARVLVSSLIENGYTLQAIWNTHGHLDHIYDNAAWKSEYSVPVLMHSGDDFLLEHLREQAIWLGMPPVEPVAPEGYFNDGDELSIGNHHAKVLHLPGHSPGSVGFYFEDQNVCFDGDVLFRGSVGRTDLPGCDPAQLKKSLQVMAQMPPQTRVLSGHGPATTIVEELANNPFLR